MQIGRQSHARHEARLAGVFSFRGGRGADHRWRSSGRSMPMARSARWWPPRASGRPAVFRLPDSAFGGSCDLLGRRPCRRSGTIAYSRRWCSGPASPRSSPVSSLNLLPRVAGRAWGIRLQRLLIPVDRVEHLRRPVLRLEHLLLTFAVSYEVFSRYVLRAPTDWAFDASYILYGALFIMAGAYALSRNAHVRGDFLYRAWPPRTAGAGWTWFSISCSSSPASSPSSIRAMVLPPSRGSATSTRPTAPTGRRSISTRR